MYSFTVTPHVSVQRFFASIPLLGVKADKVRAWTNSYAPQRAVTYSRCSRTSQTSIGPRETYDIEVDNEDHLFVLANGLIVSNSGGVAGAGKGLAGFPLVDQLIQTPRVFKGGAAHSQVDGRVTGIDPAPQGGHYVTVEGKRHHVALGHDLLVKHGQTVEAGDVLSEGVPNPAEIVRHKGIGEGRRYFTGTMLDAYQRSGMTAHRRNIELVARGLIDHVRLTEERGRYGPDDVVPYSRLEHHYEPREGHQTKDPRQAVGMYLEKPTLHYSIGTKVRPSVLRDLQEFGVKQVTVHPEKPPFEPEMVRGMENLTHDPDWLVRFLGSYVKKNFLKGVHRGDVSDEKGTSYVPSLVRAVDFNKFGPVQGYEPAKPTEPTDSTPAKKTSLLAGLSS